MIEGLEGLEMNAAQCHADVSESGGHSHLPFIGVIVAKTCSSSDKGLSTHL